MSPTVLIFMSKRRNKLRDGLSNFLRAYGRRGPSPSDANDRHYSPELERQIKKMDAVELDRLMRGEDDDQEDDDREVVTNTR